MIAYKLISSIWLQTNAGTNKNIAMLDTGILIPAICCIMALVMIAGIAVAVQKHKRY